VVPGNERIIIVLTHMVVFLKTVHNNVIEAIIPNKITAKNTTYELNFQELFQAFFNLLIRN